MICFIKDIWSCRFFWLSLVRIDLRMRYRRSIIGLGWSLLRPVAMTFILCLVFQKLFHRQDTWSYAPYLIAGLTCWNYIVTATMQGCQCFFQGESYIRQHPAPMAIYPLRIALGETVHFLIGLAVVLGLTWYANGFGNLLALVSLLPALLLLFAMIWSLALIAGFANVFFQDTQHLAEVFFQIIFYLTPIIYEARDLGNGRLGWLVGHCNPLLPVIQLIREPIVSGQVPSLHSYAIAGLMVLVVGCLAIVTCARYQRQIIYHL